MTQTQVSNMTITPTPPLQHYSKIEWVYPNDGESEFYTYEQMENDWVPSDIEYSSSDEEDDDMYCQNEYDEW